ncbi:4'-phosphopantetheinyl transferase family protein [Neisseria sp. S1]|uniref:4'-phosphopantetheinyl transferase family protein n=1 Tax=Neisseria sp. S1 TaxID=3318354 RepID=UPI003A89E1BD
MNTKYGHTINILLAGPDCAFRYQGQNLDEADQMRLSRNPALKQRPDWQTSRFLKQESRLNILSLSHSKGAAVLADAAIELPIGVDIEYICTRDFPNLAAYSCSGQEQTWLAARGWLAVDFYRFWTLKESLIKAAALDFPADMAKVGIDIQTDGNPKIKNLGGYSWHGISALCGNWALACVWRGEPNLAPQWHIFGNLGTKGLQDIWLL